MSSIGCALRRPTGARRNLTDTFFLTHNSVVVAFLGGLPGELRGAVSVWPLLPGFLILLSSCGAWYVMVLSRRQLSSAKFVVVGKMEERLPAFAFSRAEWRALGEGTDRHPCVPLTRIEQWVPIVFAVAHLIRLLSLVV
ncbi:RipA family octameric membrane protein [Streptomyces sp. NPDC054802]